MTQSTGMPSSRRPGPRGSHHHSSPSPLPSGTHSTSLVADSDRYALLASLVRDAVWEWDLLTNEVNYSSRWEDVVGIGSTDLGKDLSAWMGRIPAADRPRVEESLGRLRQGLQGEFEFDHPILHRDGQQRWVHVAGRVLTDPLGQPARVVGTLRDVTKQHLVEQRLVLDAYQDPTTGLPSRAYLVSEIEDRLERCRLEPAIGSALLVVSIDRIKQWSMGLGAERVRELVRQLAARLASSLLPGEIVARVGEESFAVLLPVHQGQEEAVARAQEILALFERPVLLADRPLFVPVSVGIVLCRPSAHSAEELLQQGEVAAHHAELAGRTRCEVFHEQMVDHRRASLFLESELRLALERNEFELRYQPIIDVATGRLSGFEALVRWRHGKMGLIEPSAFIPLAEESGLIVPLGQWILKEACEQMGRWQAQFPAREKLSISVNLSGRQLADPDLVAVIRQAKQTLGLGENSLRLEITESLMVDDVASASSMLQHLRDMGVGIHVDDFGTGYSSLAKLPQLPLDTLKIDRSFIQAMLINPPMEEIVRTIITLAHALGMDVTAEGVESREHLTKLRELKCDRGQGYFISPPLEAFEVERLLAHPKRWE